MTDTIWQDENSAYAQGTLVLDLDTTLTVGVNFVVLIDGNPISSNGATTGTVEWAPAASGTGVVDQTQLIINGAFCSGTHQVTIELLASTAYAEPEISLTSASIDGKALSGDAASISGTSAYSFDFTGVPAAVPAPSVFSHGSGSIDLYFSEDAFMGNAEFDVYVNGVLIGLPQAVHAINSLGQSQEFILEQNFAPGTTYQIGIDFINDAWAGTQTTDRNLYLDKATLSGATITGSSFGLYGDGTQSFSFTEPGTSTVAGGTGVAGSLTYVGVNEGMGPNAPQNDPGVYGTNWTYPTDAELLYEKSQGMNIIRLGFLDDRVATDASGALSASGLALLDPVVAYATSIGLKVILDDHEYGDYFGTELLANTTANTEYDTFWGNLAANFASNPNVYFGIMNEPNVQTAGQWAAVAQGAVNAIRAAGATQEVLVSGTNWDGAASWYSTSSDGTSNAVALLGITDPDHNMVFEVHSYPDATGGGTSSATSTTTGVDRLQAVTQWAITNHETLFLGETGGTTSATSLQAIDNELTYIQANSNVWQGVSEWAAGPWWGDYQYSLEPTQLTSSGTTAYNQPQMTQLDTFAPTYTGSAWTA